MRVNWKIGDRIRAWFDANVTRNASGARESGMFFVGAILPILIRFLTGALIIVLCLWMAAGAVKMVLALDEMLKQAWTEVIEHVIINALIMLALLEVIRTLQVYLQLGYVRVVFILDTALVVLIGELMGLWFREYAPEKVLLSLGVIVVLVVLRAITSRFSPDLDDDGRAKGAVAIPPDTFDQSINDGDKS